jgi:hypothetical protein
MRKSVCSGRRRRRRRRGAPAGETRAREAARTAAAGSGRAPVDLADHAHALDARLLLQLPQRGRQRRLAGVDAALRHLPPRGHVAHAARGEHQARGVDDDHADVETVLGQPLLAGDGDSGRVWRLRRRRRGGRAIARMRRHVGGGHHAAAGRQRRAAQVAGGAGAQQHACWVSDSEGWGEQSSGANFFERLAAIASRHGVGVGRGSGRWGATAIPQRYRALEAARRVARTTKAKTVCAAAKRALSVAALFLADVCGWQEGEQQTA